VSPLLLRQSCKRTLMSAFILVSAIYMLINNFPHKVDGLKSAVNVFLSPFSSVLGKRSTAYDLHVRLRKFVNKTAS